MKIGVVAAMHLEIECLLSQCEIINEIKLKKNVFYQCELGDTELVIIASGVGKTNASVYTQILIDFFEVQSVVNIGIAGGISNQLKPLDIVLGTSFSHHDVNISQMEQLFPYKSVFNSTQELIQLFDSFFSDKMIGKIVSGESFVASKSEKEKILKEHSPLLVDMETSSIAHCCFINDIPFISLRAVSDMADESAETTYENNDQIAADKVGSIFVKALEEKIS